MSVTVLPPARPQSAVDDALSFEAEMLELTAFWLRWRATVRAHVHAKREAGVPFHPGVVTGFERLDALGLGLPTFSAQSRAGDAWMEAAARYRREHPLEGNAGAAYVVNSGSGFEAVCPTHPSFRRVAWTHQRTPLSSAREHNTEHHEGARAVIISDPAPALSSLLP